MVAAFLKREQTSGSIAMLLVDKENRVGAGLELAPAAKSTGAASQHEDGDGKRETLNSQFSGLDTWPIETGVIGWQPSKQICH